MPHSDDHHGEPETKKFRSVREYREMKRIQKRVNGATDRSLSPEQNSNEGDTNGDTKEEFVKLLKDTVAHLCYGRLVNFDDSDDRDPNVPEWRRVCRIISQTLLEKESRMPPEVRYKVSPASAREAVVKRIQGYTITYLDRKYPE